MEPKDHGVGGHEEESAQLASELITKACWAHEVQRDQLVLHSTTAGR